MCVYYTVMCYYNSLLSTLHFVTQLQLHVQLYTYIIHVPGTEEEDYYYLGTLPWYCTIYNLQLA